MPSLGSAFVGLLPRFTSRLRFPQLFALTLAVFVVDLFVPDMIPFIDEVLLGLTTLLLGNWKRRPKEGPIIDIEDIEPEN